LDKSNIKIANTIPPIEKTEGFKGAYIVNIAPTESPVNREL
jgi:hypothetical protein